MLRLFTLLLLLASSAAAHADSFLSEKGITTPAFTLRFPAGWKLLEKRAPVPVQGPNHEMMLISPIMPAPDAKQGMENSEELADFWRDKIKSALSGSVTQEGMMVVQPYRESEIDGMPYFVAAARVPKDGVFLGSYGLIGKNGVVFIVTVEGELKDEAKAKSVTESMLKSIQWHLK